MLRGKTTLFIDQYGGKWFANTVKDLQQQIGGKVSKMYVDSASTDDVYHTGYVVGQLWLDAFVPVRVKQ